METIGEKISKLRKAKHITQEELSFQLYVSRQTIHNWEANAMLPNAENIKALCKYFDVNSDYFLVDSEHEEVNEEVVVASDLSKKNKAKRIAFIVLSVVLALSFVVLLIITIILGCAFFTDNNGQASVSTIEIDVSAFVTALVFSVVSMLASITFIILSIKSK